jgi:ferredoxin
MRISGIQVARRIALGIALAGITVAAFLHQKLAGAPPIDALDPFGGLETLLKFVAGGETIQKIAPGTIVLFGAVVVLGILLSRFFCGWLCAFGALQAVFGWIGRKILRRRFTVPRKLDAVLRWIKYPLLLGIVWLSWRAGELVIRPYDPMAAYGHLSTGLASVWSEFAVGFVVLAAVMLLSALYDRVFCKYLCPLGAMLAILSRVPFFRVRREASTCISCSKCDRACPMNIEVATAASVDSPECIACLECVTACPTGKGTLAATLAGKAVKAPIVVALGLGVYLLAALVGSGLGMLSFAPAVPKIEARAPAGAPLAASAEAIVVPAGFELEGWMTLDQAAAALAATPEALLAKLKLPPDMPRDQPLRTLKDKYGFSMSDLKKRIKE